MSATLQLPATDVQFPLLGDLVHGGASGVGTVLAGNTAGAIKFLSQTGTGAVSAAPTWHTLVAGDIPSLSYMSNALTSAHIFVGNVSNVATDVAMTGDISITNAGLTAIGANKVTLAMMATIANNTVLGNISGGAAVPSALTLAQVLAIDTTVTPQFARLGLGHPADATIPMVVASSSVQQGYFYGWDPIGGAADANGCFVLGNTPTDRLILHFNSATGFSYLDSTLDDPTGAVILRTRTSGTPINALKVTDTAATFPGSLTTGAPAGGTAGAWKCGIKVTAASVFNTTGYIQLDVGGVLWKLALCV